MNKVNVPNQRATEKPGMGSTQNNQKYSTGNNARFTEGAKVNKNPEKFEEHFEDSEDMDEQEMSMEESVQQNQGVRVSETKGFSTNHNNLNQQKSNKDNSPKIGFQNPNPDFDQEQEPKTKIQNQNQDSGIQQLMQSEIGRPSQRISYQSNNNLAGSVVNHNAIQFVDKDADQLRKSNEAVQVLACHQGNIGFVAIAGQYRTGKSFIMNRLLQVQGKGFQVESSVNACTQGIWIWSKPLFNAKENTHIFFMDTEGAQSTDSNPTHDAKIFALSLLLCSYFIYNSQGCIDETSISQLSLTTSLSRNIAISEHDDADEYTLSYYTPQFLWLLRDFTLEIQNSRGQPITPNQYLDSALMDETAIQKTNDQNKKIRRALLNYFQDRECMTMVRPVAEESQLRKLDDIPTSNLRKEFIAQLQGLRQQILTKCTCQTLNGVPLNARMFINLCQGYIQNINEEGGVPNISYAWDHIVQEQCITGYNAAVELYQEYLQRYLDRDESLTFQQLFEVLQTVRDTTIDKFNNIAGIREQNAHYLQYQEKVIEHINNRQQTAFQINDQMAKISNNEILKSLTEQIKENQLNNLYTIENIESYIDDFQKLLDQYGERGKGSQKAEVFLQFLKSFHPELIKSLVFSIEQKYKTKNVNGELEKQLSSEQEKSLRNTIIALQDKINIQQDEITRLQTSQQQLDKEKMKLEQELKEINLQLSELQQILLIMGYVLSTILNFLTSSDLLTKAIKNRKIYLHQRKLFKKRMIQLKICKQRLLQIKIYYYNTNLIFYLYFFRNSIKINKKGAADENFQISFVLIKIFTILNLLFVTYYYYFNINSISKIRNLVEKQIKENDWNLFTQSNIFNQYLVTA